MTVRPPAGSFAEAIYEQMEPVTWADEMVGWALLLYLDGIGQMLQDLDYLSHYNPPWQPMINIDLVPNEGLQWLAQFVGAILDTTVDYDSQRQQIRDHVGWNRGTPATFISLGKARLTGTQTLELTERFNSPYRFRVITWQDETPPEDWPVTNLISNPSFETNTTGWFVE